MDKKQFDKYFLDLMISSYREIKNEWNLKPRELSLKTIDITNNKNFSLHHSHYDNSVYLYRVYVGKDCFDMIFTDKDQYKCELDKTTMKERMKMCLNSFYKYNFN